MKTLLSLILLLFSYQSVFAQIGLNQYPPNIKWKKIDTPHFEIIFPENLYKSGQRVANTLEYIYKPISKSLDVKIKHTPVILNNRSIISNGFVRLAPRKSEWWSTPAQNSFIGDWYNVLALHETRHIVQFDKTNNGFTKIMSLLFGDVGHLAFSGWTIPMWFWEGDAIVMETVLSKGGRGRSAEFDMEIRTNLLSGKQFSYYKAYFRSYKDWYPNHYHLGYLLTAYVRQKYGNHVWNYVLNRSARYSYWPFIMSSSLKKVTGKNLVGIYNTTMNDLKSRWQQQIKDLNFTDVRIINNSKRKAKTDYLYPQYTPDGSIITCKQGMDLPSTLIKLNSKGKEQRIKQFSPYDPVSVNGDKIVWNRIAYDLRWGKQDYTEIVMYDLNTGKTRQVIGRSKFLAPAVSPNGKYIAVVEYTENRECAVVILHSDTAIEYKRLNNFNNDYLISPSWSSDSDKIVIIRQNANGRGVALVDINTAQITAVLPLSWEQLSHPVLYKNYVLYSSPYSGIDNIYAVEIESKQRYQVTSRKFGAFNPAVSTDGTKLIFNDYSVKGHNVAEINLDINKWRKIEDVEGENIKFYEPLIAQENKDNYFSLKNIPQKKYDIEDYNKNSNLLNFHSWLLLPLPPILYLQFFSANILNSVEVSPGFFYNDNEKTGNIFVNTTYAGLYPIFSVGALYGGRFSSFTDINDEKVYYTWNEKTVNLGASIPFNLSRGIYSSALTIGTVLGLTEISEQEYDFSYDKGNGLFSPVTHSLSYYRYKQSSIRDLKSRFGQALGIIYRHTPFMSDYKGQLFSLNSQLLFPGIFKHHSIGIKGHYEHQKYDNYIFPEEFTFPRGYDYQYFDSLYKISLNYTLPLLYPDFGLGSFLYFKRITTNLFYDHGVGKIWSIEREYKSAGFELFIEFHPLSIPFSISLGLRYSYRFNDRDFKIQPVIGDIYM